MSFKTVGLIFKKELSDLFRDKKTVLVGILIPLLLLPIMFYFMSAGIEKTAKKENFNIAIEDKGKSSLDKFLKEKDDLNIKTIEFDEAEDKVKNGEIAVVITIPDNFEENIKNGVQTNIDVIYDDSSQTSSMVFSKVNQYIGEFSQNVVKTTLTNRGIDPSVLLPVNINKKTIVEEDDGVSKMIMSMIIPLFIVLYCVTGPLPAATDLGAGEKERGTLEPLLTTKASRLSILYGKVFAITILGIITAIAAIAGLVISFKISPGVFGGGVENFDIGISPLAILIIFIFTVLTSMAFGALELAISIYARSFKEAQTYTTPLTILAFVPTFLMYTVDGKNIDNIYFHIPIANVMSILKEVTLGVINIQHILVVLGWMIAYIVISVAIARYMFNKENVIFRT
ncbi:ABC transporter permease [Clostridium sp. ATCC 25772]|uniref:ABC transporter permease n=1 Tax=Clostridium sp. ATCC 25772 TaxID=1676991 RepID=UPI0007853668|nr:ABC transporter permease [Clostridium sp. ATCC 25772]